MSEKENIDDNMESNPIKLKKKKTRLKKAIKREKLVEGRFKMLQKVKI